MEKIVKDDINMNLEEILTPNGSVKVGMKYPYTVGEVGGLMELLPQGGFYMKLVANDVNQDDINLFRYGDVAIKTLFNNDKVYMLIRFGDGTLLYEILFDPTLYPDKELTKINLHESNIIHCIFIDKESGKVQGIKMFNFPLDTYKKLVEAWTEALDNHKYTEEYHEYCVGFFGQDIGYWWEAIL